MTQQREDEYDVLVIGGGPAGLGGAVTLGRSRRTVAVVDAGQPRNAPAAGVHGYLTRDGLPPAELVRLGRQEAQEYGARLVAGSVEQVQRAEDGRLTVLLADGRTLNGRRLLVTTGLVDELPDVPGLRERWAAMSCTARTATAGRSATSRSPCWRPGRCRCTRRCCSVS